MGRLLRTVAVVGAAKATANAVDDRHDAKQAAAAEAAAPAAPAVAPGDDIVSQLTKLGELKGAGVLSEAEFEAAKAKLLA
ncbi:MAG: SHOCT domain-containing protein [Actinomycetota bacterium]|nr:SHOCT domain-containing protein [Actinomycetota bacterium]